MRLAFNAVAAAGVIVVVSYLGLWWYVNQHNAIRCHEYGGTPTQIGVTQLAEIWGSFDRTSTHCAMRVPVK